MAKSVLIFPAGMPRSMAYLERALSEGKSVIGSSSLGHDPAREHYPKWVHLPYVTAPDFDEELRQVIADFDIDGIFTPNPVVWDYLNRGIAESFPGVTLINPSPVASEVAPYHKALQFGASVLSEPLAVAGAGETRPSVSALEIAALFHHADSIPGMCDHEKIRALCELFRHAPAGDVVEIGSWWGKSAFVLMRLASCYNIGNLLCADPWSNEHLIQNDEKGLVDRVSVNADEALTVFQLNLLPYAHGSVNYMRRPSVDAAVEYRRSQQVATAAFGETHYTGRIAVLHVDGNHSYDSVRADVLAWADLVLPGGWIIIDDYIWPYGDGPQRVADEFLRNQLPTIDCAFVMGGALFIKLDGVAD
ncbi:class I SAM-dependent methyltransferase [Pseudomonas sp. S1Bt23]|uniref:class I SAM-dependent methyltransferase n=1 Tax=Pseudomonas sp. S1Bt23 TaxID=3095074 RepID=UPI002A5AAC4D|nr:class I SAM-dependent methyltransferase [Pseudomonas sp. S1Bt23]WPO46854.1 class I SAM-dependent methyltransferase [Pseudomonas sp. S1Bt23]